MISDLTPARSLEWGSGDSTIVFLHYFGGAAESWTWVAQQLLDCRCVAINLPGFGNTFAPQQLSIPEYTRAVIAEVERLGLADYLLVGHSMGGKIALQVAVSSQKPPRQVVLVAPSPPTTEPMPESEKQRMLSNHPSRENAETTLKNAAKAPLTDEQRQVATQTHMIVDDSAWRWWLREGMNNSIANQMNQLAVPVTVLASQDDPVIPFDVIHSDVIGVIPNAELKAIAGVGHLIPLEAPDWVAAQLRDIIAA
ncbi:MAG: alpha/beta hydrolase [Cyanobacteria bacterium P01_A01_bin.135]